MRKNHVKQILYLWLVGIIFGCSSPEFLLDEQNKSNRNIKMEILKADAIKKHPRLFTRVSKLNEAILQRNANQKNVSSTIYNFSINTNLCKMITVDSLTTYTFEVIREQDNGFFENLVVKEKPDGTFKTTLYQYAVTAQEKENILNGIDVDMTNKISTLTIDDPSFVSDIFSKVYFSMFCYEASTVIDPGRLCFQNLHAHPADCLLSGSQAPVLPSTNTVYTMVPCPDSGGGGSGLTGPTDTGGFDGTGTSPTGGGSGPPTFGDEDAPCSKLKQVSVAMKSKLNTIDDSASASNCESCEFGYQMENNSSDPNNPQIGTGLLIASNKNSIKTSYTSTSVGLIHSHSVGLNQMFSFSDVFNLWQLLQNTQQTNWSLGVVYLVSPFGITYAIKTNNIAAFNGFISTLVTNTKGKNTMQKVNKLNDKLAQEHPAPNPFGLSLNEQEKMEEDFLLFFANAGLSIYSTTDSNFENWDKLSLSNNSQERVTRTPCN